MGKQVGTRHLSPDEAYQASDHTLHPILPGAANRGGAPRPGHPVVEGDTDDLPSTRRQQALPGPHLVQRSVRVGGELVRAVCLDRYFLGCRWMHASLASEGKSVGHAGVGTLRNCDERPQAVGGYSDPKYSGQQLRGERCSTVTAS